MPTTIVLAAMNSNPVDKKSKKWTAKLAVAFLFAGGLFLFFFFGGDQLLTLDALKNNRDALLQYTQSHYVVMLAASVVTYTVATALSVPGAVILSLAVGLLFGRWIGTLIILFSATSGATVVFLAARYLFAEAAQRKMGKRALKIVDGFHRNAFHYLLFLRLVPVFPFWLVNLVPAFTPMTLRTYFSATAIGIVPGSFVFANLGQSLGRIDSLKQLLSPETLGAFSLLGLFALLPVIIKKFGAKKALKENDSSL